MASLVLSREQVRDVDRRAIEDYGMSGLVLMENAGRGCVDLLMHLDVDGPVAVVAGRGNNAGDGFVIARHLENRGVDVHVLLFSSPKELHGDALANYRILEHAQTPVTVIEHPEQPESWVGHLEGADWIVDALLGTGTRGEIRPPFDRAIAAINQAKQRVLAVDLPSGLDCDTGKTLGVCVAAHHTATFVAMKPGFQHEFAREWTGEIHVVDIGVPRRLLDEFTP